MSDHAELSRSLAVAIGYAPEDVRLFTWPAIRKCEVRWRGKWRRFDHRDPAVIWPIAEKYNFFPMRWADGTWSAPKMGGIVNADTAAKAVALAVIGGKA